MRESELLEQAERISSIFARIMLKMMTAETLDSDITMSQFQALRHIAQHGSCTIGGLAEGLGISQPAATMLVDRMVRRGLVRRVPGRSDRRQAELTLTPRADELLARAEAERAQRLSKILSLMKPSEREQFLESLECFIDAALKVEQAVDEACLRCGIEHYSDCVVNQAHVALVGRDIERT